MYSVVLACLQRVLLEVGSLVGLSAGAEDAFLLASLLGMRKPLSEGTGVSVLGVDSLVLGVASATAFCRN